jgi:hypothetical protein
MFYPKKSGNLSTQAHNLNSCNNGSDWSDRKFIRVIWRRGRGREAAAEAAVLDGSPGQSLVLVMDHVEDATHFNFL